MSLENFTQVTTVNPRKAASDLNYNEKTGKFTVSEDLYQKLNLANNGFALYVSNDEKRIALAVVNNEDASLMRGKRGFTKGRQFTATALVTAMQEFMPGTTDFSLQHMITNEGIEYYEIVSAEEAPSVLDTETTQQVTTPSNSDSEAIDEEELSY